MTRFSVPPPTLGNNPPGGTSTSSLQPSLCSLLPLVAISQSQFLPPARVSNRPRTLSQSPALPVKTQTAKQNQSLLSVRV